MNQNLHVNKTNFHMKGFTLGLALRQRQDATWKWANVQEVSCFLAKSTIIWVIILRHEHNEVEREIIS